jgi:hypothetical protein
MKYLKTYENINSLWIVVTEDYMERDSSHQELFMDEESAQNIFLEIVNDYRSYQERNSKNIITTVEEAEEYVKNDLSDVCSVYYYQIYISGKHKLREDIRLAREANKYNL